MKSFMQRIKDRKNPKPVGIASADVERARSPKEGETTDNKPKNAHYVGRCMGPSSSE